MPSTTAKITTKFLHTLFSGWSDGTIDEQRKKQENSTRIAPLPKQIKRSAISIDHIPAECIETSDSNSGTILYLHGGAYALGSINSHRELISRLVIATNCKALALDYRLAPENPYPAALEDTIYAYKWLLTQGGDPSQIMIAGDSAGGGLAVAALIHLRDSGLPLPAGSICFSPWFDLTLNGDSVKGNAKLDPILESRSLEMYANYYAGTHEKTDPLISPLFANLAGLPPINIHVGTNEILLDDAIRFNEKAQQAGVECHLKTWQGLFHVFQLFSFLPETRNCLKEVGEFVATTIYSQ